MTSTEGSPTGADPSFAGALMFDPGALFKDCESLSDDPHEVAPNATNDIAATHFRSGMKPNRSLMPILTTVGLHWSNWTGGSLIRPSDRCNVTKRAVGAS